MYFCEKLHTILYQIQRIISLEFLFLSFPNVIMLKNNAGSEAQQGFVTEQQTYNQSSIVHFCV